MKAPPGASAPTPTLTPQVDGDAAKAAWLSRLARRTLRGELSGRAASRLARQALTERCEWTELEFIDWLMRQYPGGAKPRRRHWRVGEGGGLGVRSS